ncbi:uncharacterized protein Aud_006800 [Aspergillus udagawae]|uniref:BZIP domain-containing protein n=2 Tax=Aspergillus udagawae TaxID=91492 RepID=A0A8E0QWP2_9EURO|nr:uncharacterized protein Aud_006800 [Aspergillus udagawae]GIC90366.1 hypothetical protein Aud_006800 [Aspergillus udagawae]
MTFQGHQGTGGMPPSRTTASPTSSPTTSSIDTEASGPKTAKRRVQNREAQRRFRERKEQQKKLLQKNAEDLRNEYQILLKQYTQTASDVTRLVKENVVLRVEVKNLRQQWRMIFAVLQRLQGAHSAAALPEDEFPFDDVQGYLEELASATLSNSTH